MPTSSLYTTTLIDKPNIHISSIIMKKYKNKKSQQPPKVIRASSASIDISGSLTGSLSDEDVAPMSSIKVCHNGSRSTSPLGGRKRRIIRVSTQFLILTLMIVTSVAFIVGTLSRIVLLGSLGIIVHPLVDSSLVLNQYSNLQEDTTSSMHAVDMVTQLPKPIAIHEVPLTTFTSTNFPQDSARTSHTVHIDRQVMTQKVEDDDYANAISPSTDEEVRLPSGQHLLIDIKNVDSNFLNSERQLAEAMVQLVNESKLTLLSYHCHSLIPMGVSCVGVLLESHVSIYMLLWIISYEPCMYKFRVLTIYHIISFRLPSIPFQNKVSLLWISSHVEEVY